MKNKINKTLLILALFLSLINKSKAQQEYLKTFDTFLNKFYNGTGENLSRSLDITSAYLLYDQETRVLDGLLLAYKASGNTVYLDKFIKQSRNIQLRRDDNLVLPNGDINKIIIDNSEEFLLQSTVNTNNTFPCQITSNNAYSYSKDNKTYYIPKLPNSRGWSSYYYEKNAWIQFILHDAVICQPMLEFTLLVLKEKTLLKTELVKESNTFMINGNNFTTNNYLEYANWLLGRVKQTIAYHDDEFIPTALAIKSTWFANSGNYYYYDDAHTTLGMLYRRDGKVTYTDLHIADINMQCAMGSTLMLLNAIEPQTSYQNKIQHITRAYKYSIDWTSSDNSNSIVSFGEYFNSNSGTHLTEDLGHGALIAKFCCLAYKYNFATTVGGKTLYDLNFMKRLARTFTNRIYSTPHKFSRDMWGHDINGECGPECDAPVNSRSTVDFIGLWSCLVDFDPDINQIISDYYSDYMKYASYIGTSTSPSSCSNINTVGYSYNIPCTLSSTVIQSVANLAKSQKFFNPIAVNRDTWADSKFAGAVQGEFDYDKSSPNQFATLRNRDGAIEVYSVSLTSNPRQFTQIASTVLGVDWAGIAAADLDQITYNGKFKDEIFALHFRDNAIYVYEKQINNQYLVKLKVIPLPVLTTGNKYTSITSGTFNGVKYVVAFASTGYACVLKYSGGNYILSGLINVPSRKKFVGATTGKFISGDSKDYIATINSDNSYIDIYDFTGTTFTLKYSFQGASSTSQWNGICAGDFDGDAITEIMAHRNEDGDFFVFKVKSGVIVNTNIENFPINMQHGVMCKFNNISGGSGDALLTLRKFDGNMTIYNMKTSSMYRSVSDQTSLPETSSNEILNASFYPNPANSSITIINPTSSEVKVEIFDILGHKLYETKFKNDKNNINIDDLSEGLYLIILSSDNRKWSSKLIKE